MNQPKETQWQPITRLPAGPPTRQRSRRQIRQQARSTNGSRTRRNNGQTAAQPELHEEALKRPERWEEPRTITVEGDLFADSVPFPWIRRIFKAMAKAPQHRYLLLTRNIARLVELSPRLPWHPCICTGVTIRDARDTYQMDLLRQSDAPCKYVRLEPETGDLPELNLDSIDWVMVAGDRGPGTRRINPDWVRSVRDQCVEAGIPFRFCGWGGRNGKATDRELDGRIWNEMPKPEEPEVEPNAEGVTGTTTIVAATEPASFERRQVVTGPARKRRPFLKAAIAMIAAAVLAITLAIRSPWAVTVMLGVALATAGVMTITSLRAPLARLAGRLTGGIAGERSPRESLRTSGS